MEIRETYTSPEVPLTEKWNKLQNAQIRLEHIEDEYRNFIKNFIGQEGQTELLEALRPKLQKARTDEQIAFDEWHGAREKKYSGD